METCHIHTTLPFRHVFLEVDATAEFDMSGYLDLKELSVYSHRRDEFVEVSDEFMRKFQEANWLKLEDACIAHHEWVAECYREMRREDGDWLYHSRKEEGKPAFSCRSNQKVRI